MERLPNDREIRRIAKRVFGACGGVGGNNELRQENSASTTSVKNPTRSKTFTDGKRLVGIDLGAKDVLEAADTQLSKRVSQHFRVMNRKY